MGGESISARSVESLTVRYGSEREEEGQEERWRGVFGTSVFPSVTCCLFDFALTQDKHLKDKSRPPDHGAFPLSIPTAATPLRPSEVEERGTSVSICIFL